jgi:hypothetical protein
VQGWLERPVFIDQDVSSLGWRSEPVDPARQLEQTSRPSEGLFPCLFRFVRGLGWVGPCGQLLSSSWLVLEILGAIFRVGRDPKKRGWGDAADATDSVWTSDILVNVMMGGSQYPCRWNMTGWLDLMC